MHAGILFSDLAVYNLYSVAMKCSKAFMWCFFSIGSTETKNHLLELYFKTTQIVNRKVC
jgi:hypothetical protein